MAGYDGGYDPNTYDDTDPKDAAVSVAVMIVMAAVVLTVLKKSGFRAMVAVGRG
jgi:hypothetical protein